jgi:hypothetical protein
MKLDPSIIALKDFENNTYFRLKLARYSTALKAPSINVSERNTKSPIRSQHGTQLIRTSRLCSQHRWTLCKLYSLLKLKYYDKDLDLNEAKQSKVKFSFLKVHYFHIYITLCVLLIRKF